MSEKKRVPMTQEEVKQLVDLVQLNPVLLSKVTNAPINQLKEATWLKVTNLFNSMISSCPRKPEQLKLKWDNLKKAARKRCKMKTEEEALDYISPDKILDKVEALLSSPCDEYSVPFECDAVMEEHSVIENEEAMENTSNSSTCKQSHQQPEKFYFPSETTKGELENQSLADEVKKSIIKRNLAIAEYYQGKKQDEQAINALKKRKLELEISQWKKKTKSIK